MNLQNNPRPILLFYILKIPKITTKTPMQQQLITTCNKYQPKIPKETNKHQTISPQSMNSIPIFTDVQKTVTFSNRERYTEMETSERVKPEIVSIC